MLICVQNKLPNSCASNTWDLVNTLTNDIILQNIFMTGLHLEYLQH